MALYDNTILKTFYTEIGNDQDVCYYCENLIRMEQRNRKINIDEMHKRIKNLRGHVSGKKVAKFNYVGHDFCICKECISKIHSEMISYLEKTEEKDTSYDKVSTREEELGEILNEFADVEGSKQVQSESTKDKTKDKAKDKKANKNG